MEVFNVRDITELLGIKADKLKNWNAGKPFLLKPSVRVGSGKGVSNLYNKHDLYLLASANEFSNAGFAGKAIGKLLDAVRPKLAKLTHRSVLTIWRITPGGPFHSDDRRTKPTNVILLHTFEVGILLRKIDEAAVGISYGRQD